MKKKVIISMFLAITALYIVVFATSCDDGRLNIKCDSFVIYETSAPQRILTEEELQDHVAGVPLYQASQEEICCLYSAKREDDTVLWKGDKLGILTTDSGECIQVRISLYGGFFALVGSEEYYVINNSHLSVWNSMTGAA